MIAKFCSATTQITSVAVSKHAVFAVSYEYTWYQMVFLSSAVCRAPKAEDRQARGNHCLILVQLNACISSLLAEPIRQVGC